MLARFLATQVLAISSFSYEDLVSLVANYNDLINGEKHKASSAVENRGYSPEVLAHATKKFAAEFKAVESVGLRFTKPFDHFKYDLIGYVLTLFENYERGSLPFAGSVSEQPAQIMDIFSVLQQLKHEVKSKSQETKKPNVRDQHKNKPRASR